MAVPFRDNIDLGLNQLQNARTHNLSAAPSSPQPGQVYFDTTANKWFFYNSTAFIDPTARANHTGTQVSATISDLAPVVKAYTLDSFAGPAASVAFNAKNITGLADPINPQDASTKNYTDNGLAAARQGIASKPAVVVVSTANQALTGLPTVDGVALSAGQRVLLVGQTTASQNGPYTVSAGAWSRSTTDANNEIEPGALWLVEAGTTYGSTQWVLAGQGPFTVGTTTLPINNFSAAGTYTASNGVAKTGNNFAGVVDPAGALSVSAAGFAAGPTLARTARGTITGTGAATSFTVTHNLGNANCLLQLADASGNVTVVSANQATANTATFSFGQAPANAATFSWLCIG